MGQAKGRASKRERRKCVSHDRFVFHSERLTLANPSNTHTHTHTPYLSHTEKCFYSITSAPSLSEHTLTHSHSLSLSLSLSHTHTHTHTHTYFTLPPLYNRSVCRRVGVWESLSVAMVMVASSSILNPMRTQSMCVCVCVCNR